VEMNEPSAGDIRMPGFRVWVGCVHNAHGWKGVFDLGKIAGNVAWWSSELECAR
jgi:hypothetical protein